MAVWKAFRIYVTLSGPDVSDFYYSSSLETHLPAVPCRLALLVLSVMLIREFPERCPVKFDLDPGHLVVALDSIEDVIPDLARLMSLDTWVAQRDVNAGLEGLVDHPDPVGGEEEDASVVFKLTKEHCEKISRNLVE